ncbi:hypothetical protein ACQPZF_13270 [Actinosynnema sp. CS-041913]|uniref:hypothetical protein n=1 Tax=Actinosynnema sp. CS-041913 TaxID=3239917 RepID=UPI003D90BBC7
MVEFESRPYGPEYEDPVGRLFESSDFCYRTTIPMTLGHADIRRLAAGSRVVLADGLPVGLWSVDSLLWSAAGQDVHSGLYLLHLRLASFVPVEWWRAVYRRVLDHLRDRQEVARISFEVNEFDLLGQDVAEALGLRAEGLLPDLVERDGRRWGRWTYGAVWPVAAPAGRRGDW